MDMSYPPTVATIAHPATSGTLTWPHRQAQPWFPLASQALRGGWTFPKRFYLSDGRDVTKMKIIKRDRPIKTENRLGYHREEVERWVK